MPFQTKVNMDAPPLGKGQYPKPEINLENAFVEINGKRHRVFELLKLVADKLKADKA